MNLKAPKFAFFPLIFLSFVTAVDAKPAALPLNNIKMPAGFKIAIFAEVPGARSLAKGANGTIFVGTMNDKVYAVQDLNDDGIADKVHIIAKNLDQPNGVAFKDGALYVAEISKISRYDGIETHLTKPPKPVTLPVKFPTDKHHGWKFISIGPDGKLYVPVGAPCNICESAEDYAAIFRIDLDGKNKELFAKGIRNTVGFDWHPDSHELYFTENGRDMMGDDIPPDELNVAPKAGLDFGYPRCHAGTIEDPEFGKKPSGKDKRIGCANSEKPAALLDPHGAALGMRFYKGTQFPKAYKNNIFIAQHGSWNRSRPIGYQISVASVKGDKTVVVEPFATGWLKNDTAWGRPVDVLELADGSLLVSDDTAGVIYRISYKAPKT